MVKRGAISTFITRGAFEVFYDLPTADSQPVTTALYLATKIGSEVVYFDKQVFNAS